MDERTDEALVSETLAGNREAFAALVRRYQDYVYATAVGVVSDIELGRDAAQEAFLRAYRGLATLRDASRFGGWLHGIVRRTATTALRERARGQRLAAKLRVEPAPAATAPDRDAETAEVRATVHRALARLSDPAREAVCLFYVDGLSYADIARYLGVTSTAVQGRLQRARAKLRKELVMIDQTLKDSAPDDAFARRVVEAVEVYTTKGPAIDSIGSPWQQKLSAKTHEILSGGQEGFRVDVAMSRSNTARIRVEALLHFRLRGDRRALSHVRRLLADPVDPVRAGAAVTYASLIRGDRSVGLWEVSASCATVPEGIERILPLADEPRWRMRMLGVHLLGAYAACGDPRVDAALAKALADPKHKIRHTVARKLGRPCPTCGTRPGASAASRDQWHCRRYQAAARRIGAGDEGFAADVALSRSAKSRRRREAVLRLAMRDEPRAGEHVRRLLADENANVRRHAMIAWAMAIHPARDKAPLDRLATPAKVVPDGVEALLACADDTNDGNRKVLARLLGDYVPLGDDRVRKLLEGLLDAEAYVPHVAHKVRHAAAVALGVPCPVCGPRQD